MGEYETILLSRVDDVGILTLNRPEKVNAIDNVMSVEWGTALQELDDDLDVAAIVMTGAGRGFTSGADFTRFEANIRAVDGEGRVEQPRWERPWIEQVRSSKPIVCAVNGACIGAGLTRILPCDVRIASAATFSMRFVKIGIVPEIGSTQILPQIVGLQNAADLVLSGRTIDAHEALRIGLVLRVVEPDELMPAAIALAKDYSANGTDCVREIKQLLYASYVEQDMSVVQGRERDGLARRRGTPENREAVAAFREKRQPDFRKLRGS